MARALSVLAPPSAPSPARQSPPAPARSARPPRVRQELEATACSRFRLWQGRAGVLRRNNDDAVWHTTVARCVAHRAQARMVDVMPRRVCWVRPPSALSRGCQLRIGKETAVVYIGIDLHRKTSHVAAFDEQGVELLSRRVRNDPEALRALFAELGGEARVALEAAFGWEWLADLLEGEGIELHLAHPRHTKAIAAARVKTDAVDARRSPTCCAPICSPRPTSHRHSARAARAAPPPHRAHPPAHRAQKPRPRAPRPPGRPAPPRRAVRPHGRPSSASSLCPSRAAAGSRACSR